MAFKYGYVLTRNAVDDFDEIVRYIAHELGNPTAASRFIDKLKQTIDETCAFPESGPKVVNEFLSGHTVRSKVIGSYMMYYLADKNTKTVSILRIVYGRRDLNEILRKLGI